MPGMPPFRPFALHDALLARSFDRRRHAAILVRDQDHLRGMLRKSRRRLAHEARFGQHRLVGFDQLPPSRDRW